MHRSRRVLAVWTTLASLSALLTFTPEAPSQDASTDAILLRQALVIDPVGVATRSAIHTDAIERLIVEGQWTPPVEGGVVQKPDGSKATWKMLEADKAGWMIHTGYVSWIVHLDHDAIMMLDASGHSLVYVNGEVRPGDPYQYGNFSLPVSLHAGDNELLFYISRDRLHANLTRPKAEVFFDLRDATLPDLLRGEGAKQASPAPGGVVIVNATRKAWNGQVVVRIGDEAALRQAAGPIPPLSLRKVALGFPIPTSLEGKETIEYHLALANDENRSVETAADEASMALNVREAGDHHIRTFVSNIDGSVQMFSVRPSTTPGGNQALFLSLHGAGVYAPSQSGSYAAKDWGDVVAATNRSRYGFDWEDWGRMDAMEVLDEAMRLFGPDPNRVYLTGHSMGGHGTWQVGVQLPDRFAAIGPSAGWVSFWSYTGASVFDESTPIGRVMARATLPSDTLALSRNYLQYGVYVLHGDADDNVPVEQARQMRSHLATDHADFAYYERPGAGHWWGAACVDWPPMFDFFRDHVRRAPQQAWHVEFVTANPSISSKSQWVTIEQQQRSLVRSSIVLDLKAGERQIVGTTENVRRLVFDLDLLSQTLKPDDASSKLMIILDGSEVQCDLKRSEVVELALLHAGKTWSLETSPRPASEKRPGRGGPFKEAFRNRMVFVYGTHGTAEENAWNFAKARSDAEMFFYRGNGAVDVLGDWEFDLATGSDRNVILYGNADTNGAWPRLLAGSPIQVRRGEVVCGDRVIKGDDLACIFTYPNATDDHSLVVAVCGSGLAGSRLTDRFTYFVSGVHFPDWYIARTAILTQGIDGVVGAGFFDQSWQLDPEESAWAK